MTRQDRAAIRIGLEEWYTGVETTPDVCIGTPIYPVAGSPIYHGECDPMTCLDAAYDAMTPIPECEGCGYVAGHGDWCEIGRITS